MLSVPLLTSILCFIDVRTSVPSLVTPHELGRWVLLNLPLRYSFGHTKQRPGLLSRELHTMRLAASAWLL